VTTRRTRCEILRAAWWVVLFVGIAYPGALRAEVILQYFSTPYRELTARLPELAEAGYEAIWFPPPFKAGSIFSMGFDSYDRFDIGNKDQMGGVGTLHGTADELLEFMKMAHRFGIRVYFDNVMAHNGGPIPGYDENTPLTVQPGFVPEDFHLLKRADGFFRKMPEYPDWDNEWEVLHRNQFGLDLALETPINESFGSFERAQFPKYTGIRHPDNPEYYLDTDLPIATNGTGGAVFTFANKEPYQDVGCATCAAGSAGNGRFDWNDVNGNGQHDAGEDSEPFTDTGIDPSHPDRQTLAWGFGDGRYNMGNPVPEDVNAMLFRAVRWFIDVCRVDGFRLDAVKHVPYYFFGKDFGADKDQANWGYNGQIQEQYNISRGFSDWGNHRDSVFSTEIPRNDAMLFGEHLGSKPWWERKEQDFINVGMRIANNDLYNTLTFAVAGWGSLTGMDQPGAGTMGVDTAVMYAGSHDFNYISTFDRPSAHALILTRAGLPIIYTDGYNEAQFQDQNGKYFPQHGDNAFVGQYGDKHLPNLLYIHQLFARGDQVAKWGDSSYVAYERHDYRETGHPGNAVILAFMMARNGAGGQARGWTTTFAEGARLYNYSHYGGGFYVNVWGGQIKNDADQNPVVPAGGYFAFSWRVPELNQIWDNTDTKAITILEDGQPVGTVLHERKDGYAGDPNFNPYNVAGDTPGDYTYALPIPRITRGTNLTFLVRADGSAEDILFKLDGGMDVNSQMGLGPQTGGKRDRTPGNVWDIFLGYESMRRIYRIAEKFAARDVSRNVIGSPGCETYAATIGTAGFTVNNGGGTTNYHNGTVTWAYHDPVANNQLDAPTLQFFPAPENAAGQPVTVWVKIGYSNQAHRAFFYYTTDGATYPEGSGGTGKGTTQVIPFAFDSYGPADGGGRPEWWKATLPALSGGTVLRYKIGLCKDDAPSLFPFSASDISIKRKMEALYAITNFNGDTVGYYPNNDYGRWAVGLEEGFHVLRSKAFLNRGGAASLYNLDVQTVYYDTRRPEGAIVFPANNGDTLFGSRYGVVVRADRTASEAWYRITDSDANNDDSATGTPNGNAGWVKALAVSPNRFINSPYPKEFRFDYVNIPSSGHAQIEVRLMEISSSTNMALDDVGGHFTTLVRSVNTSGPDVRMFIAWPNGDGQTIGAGYGLKAYFSKLLADGLSTDQLLDCFTLQVNSNVQARSDLSIVYNETADYHALAYTIPNLFNGVPGFQHAIDVSFSRLDFAPLSARRILLAQPVFAPYVNFFNPPAAAEDGSPFFITLPDVAVPDVTQREFLVVVETGTNVQQASIHFTQGTGAVAEVSGNPHPTNDFLHWHFLWSFPLTNAPALIEGTYQLRANADIDGNTNTIEAYALRDARVILRQIVGSNTNDLDDDDDGIPDFDEVTAKGLPTTTPTSWNNADVHVWSIYGKSDPLLPDTDGDGLPDGLELGWRAPLAATDTGVDTNGDGWPNFQSDLDPPFYNVCENYGKVPAVDSCNEGSKTALKAGTLTDPRNPDSDFDGIPDGLEDRNRNGWVDGDGEPIDPTWEPWLARKWPTGIWSTNWLETAPTQSDSDADGLSDGYGEDKNFNGRLDIGLADGSGTVTSLLANPPTVGGVYSRKIDRDALFAQHPNAVFLETDPLDPDTDGDGLRDGWEVQYGLDPLDSGILGQRSLRTGLIITSETHGASGDPDNDGTSNLFEFINGTNPGVADTGSPPPPGDIVIGPGDLVVVGAVSNHNEFTDWTYEQLIALDPYDPLGEQANGGDVYYRPWASDGLERSRDLVAFYAHDGGPTGSGGDDTFYFRVDLNDLQANAEDSGLNLYVVIDTGNTAVGERKMVDGVDVLTDMRWEVVVALYDGNAANVYMNTPGSPDTVTLSDTLLFGPGQIEIRDKNHPFGLQQAYFNHELDSIEFSIHRKSLTDAGWNGNFAQLHFQVFTTRDGTSGGAGELDGPDIQDSIRNDWFAEDWAGIVAWNADQLRYDRRVALTTLIQWVGVSADNDRGKRIKIIPLVHGNQAIQPGNVIQNLINNGLGAGLYRPLNVHEAYEVPLTLHITPTLASAIEWARADTNISPAWRDGPAFNRRLADRIAASNVCLLASTFSDHMMPYFTPEFNADNVALAAEFLENIYGPGAISDQVFWTPERLIDHDVLAKIGLLGFSYTFIDQSQHLRRWFNHTESIGENAYRINKINNINCIAISDNFSAYRYVNHDGGPALQLRQALNRRARTGFWSGQHPQVMTFFMDWGDFVDKSKADAYDKNIRWMANKGWIQLVTPDQIANNALDISVPPNGTPDVWNRVDRGTGLTLAKTSHDWIQYSSQDNYDNWYLGSGLNQGLHSHKPLIRPGVTNSNPYGMLYFGGLVSQAWQRVQGIGDPNLSRLGRSVLHASTFETAFHTQSQNPVNMTKFSIGEFAYPDNSFDTLIDFARIAQAQTRMAAILKRVDQWAAGPSPTPQTSAEDIDLDGEDEYLLSNDRLFAVFERIGGRLVAVWVRDILGGQVFQAAGNLASYADSTSEVEGITNTKINGAVEAHRTSCLKDWWYAASSSSAYVNDLYTPADQTNGWKFTSSNGNIAKTITLTPKSWHLDVSYQVAAGTLYVRNGLSPNLYDLLINGQKTLAWPETTGGAVRLANTNYETTVMVYVGYSDAGHNAAYVAEAVDDNPGLGFTYYTLNMRNQAQTHQVEISGSGTFAFSLGFRADPSDWDGDGIPNTVEDGTPGLDSGDGDDGSHHNDADGFNNMDEYVSGTDPNNSLDYHRLAEAEGQADGIHVRFPTASRRDYFIYYANQTVENPLWILATSNGIAGTGGVVDWVDDGTLTSPHPAEVSNRVYRVDVSLPR
jgi:glycosidase